MLKRRGIIQMSYEKLASLMDMPEDHNIISVRDPREGQNGDSIYVVVDGGKMPEIGEGDSIPVVGYMRTTGSVSNIGLDWYGEILELTEEIKDAK